MARVPCLALLTILLISFSTAVSAQTLVFAVDDESLMMTGCIGPSPCLCPAVVVGDFTGSLEMTFVETVGTFDVYSVDMIDLTVNSGSPNQFPITGTGEYRVDTENSMQEMTLDVVVDGVSKDFASLGAVPGGGVFPQGFSLEVFHMLDNCQYDGLFISAVLLPPAMEDFVRGDANGDGSVNGLQDGLFLLMFQFVPGSPAPPCDDAADADDSGNVNGLVDGLFVLNFQFIPGSPPPPDPGPSACGADPTGDDLDCSVMACP